MCGIAGVLRGAEEHVSEELLLLMAGELLHRGPDGVGLYVDTGFGMVNTRLSIIDLEFGDQPLGNEDGRYWVMQNGEIYNYRELRRELEAHGHSFDTDSDTEVLVHAYEEWGRGCLDRLNGDFAFAIWDSHDRKLFLARDRFGVRPLYLHESGGTLAFASEAKALLRLPTLKRALDPAGIIDTFTLWSPLPVRSAFEGIRELPPGHYLYADGNRPAILGRWWQLRFEELEQPALGSTERAAQLREILDDATRLRLRADVPVAAYLSGGLDSSSIVALAQGAVGNSLAAYGVGFSDQRFDEREEQQAVARELGVELQQLQVTDADVGEWLPRAVRHAERPLLRTAPVPLLLLSRLVRESGVKVVLTGEGADELFGGYHIFKELRVRRFWAQQPDSPIRPLLFQRLYPFLSQDPSRGSAFFERFFATDLTDTANPLYSHSRRFATTARSLRFFRRSFLAGAVEAGDSREQLLASLPEQFNEMTPLGRAQYLEVATFLSGYLLAAQGDRMLMGNSVEGRFPFLDHRVAAFAAQLPDRLKLRGLKEKVLLRQATASLVPSAVIRRGKQPYRAPIAAAFQAQGAGYLQDLLQFECIDRSGIFDPGMVLRLLEKCRSRGSSGLGETDEMALVGIVSTVLLHEQFIANPPPALPATPQRIVRGRSVELHLAPGTAA